MKKNDTVDLLAVSAEIYKDITGKEPATDTEFSRGITNDYSDLLENANPAKLIRFADQNPFLGEMINKNRHNSLYRDAVVIILAWLVDNYRISLPKKWGYDMNYLEDFYTNVGISTMGLF